MTLKDYESLNETSEEWTEELSDPEPLSVAGREAIVKELADLESFHNLAVSITHNAKGDALLVALDHAFEEADRLGTARKAIVFTESRRTQEYLLRILSDSPYAEGIVLFNGSNNDEQSRRIYTDWLNRHQGTDRVTGSRTADMRSALVDYFREETVLGKCLMRTRPGVSFPFRPHPFRLYPHHH